MSAQSDVAGSLFESGCLKFGSFRIKSGDMSPYYIDLASLLGSPVDMCKVVEAAALRVQDIGRRERIDKLASIELKGALLLPGIACRFGFPSVVVRKEANTYGVTGRMAGAEVKMGDEILFFDDVVSEGLSKLEAVRPLQAAGAKVRDLLVVVDREQGGKEKLKKMGFVVHSLVTISGVVDSLRREGKITDDHRGAVLDFLRKWR